MKILHLTGGDLSGGAARGVYWLHNGLVKQGIDSKILISGKSNQVDSKVFAISENGICRLQSIFRLKIDHLILKAYRRKKNTIFSTGFFGFDITKAEYFKEADIIHLHWINSAMINIKHLAKIEKPIVWTMRDMWPFTGGCHYSLKCDRYKSGCGTCPQLGSQNQKDLSYYVMNRKLKFFPKKLTVVGISSWLTHQAKESLVFKDHRCVTIMNNIDIESFHMISKKIARQALGINTDKKIVLCGSTKLDDVYKGFQKYIDSLKYLNKEKILLIFFGVVESNYLKRLGFEFRSFGYLSDNNALNLVYASADVFVAPSIQEAFGKTIAEAQCCGTPTVCFDSSGPKDLVDHKITGYKAQPFDSEDLAKGINWILNSPNYNDLCKSARDKVIKEFDSKIVAEKYIQLYNEILH